MKLYGIIYAYFAGSGVDAYAINEEGKIISHHFCSSEGFAKSDLGFSGVYLPSSEYFNDERKKKYAELGYDELIWLGLNEDNFSNDLRDLIYDTLVAWEKFTQVKTNSTESISKMASQSNLVIIKGIDWTVEKSDLTLEELKVKNAYSAGMLFANYGKITFEEFSNNHYQKQTING